MAASISRFLSSPFSSMTRFTTSNEFTKRLTCRGFEPSARTAISLTNDDISPPSEASIVDHSGMRSRTYAGWSAIKGRDWKWDLNDFLNEVMARDVWVARPDRTYKDVVVQSKDEYEAGHVHDEVDRLEHRGVEPTSIQLRLSENCAQSIRPVLLGR